VTLFLWVLVRNQPSKHGSKPLPDTRFQIFFRGKSVFFKWKCQNLFDFFSWTFVFEKHTFAPKRSLEIPFLRLCHASLCGSITNQKPKTLRPESRKLPPPISSIFSNLKDVLRPESRKLPLLLSSIFSKEQSDKEEVPGAVASVAAAAGVAMESGVLRAWKARGATWS